MDDEQPKKKKRGFAVMTVEQRSAIARKGGQAAQAGGKAHRFTQEEAREAGRKGGYAVAAKRGRKPAVDATAEEIDQIEADIRRSET